MAEKKGLVIHHPLYAEDPLKNHTPGIKITQGQKETSQPLVCQVGINPAVKEGKDLGLKKKFILLPPGFKKGLGKFFPTVGPLDGMSPLFLVGNKHRRLTAV